MKCRNLISLLLLSFWLHWIRFCIILPKSVEAAGLYQRGFLGKHEAKSASIKTFVSKQALFDNGTMNQMHHFRAILQSVQYS
jgi:hypothetical protein